MIIVEHSFFVFFCRYYEMTQHSHEISRSFVLCLRFISRTISANTSLTFVRCLALASTNEQPHIWAKACKKFNSVSVSLLIRLISCVQNSPCPQQLELHVDALSRPCCPLIKSAPAIKSKFFMCGMFFSATHLLSPIINWSLNSDCFSCRIYTTEIIFVD